MTPKTITLSTGVTLEYVERGPRSGIPLLCLHGWPDSWRSYETMLPHLPATFRAVVPSLRGFGGSSRLETGYRPADFVADLRAFMDALGIMRAVIVGHSMGSVIALRFALAHPERVAGLALIGGFAGLKGHAFAQDMWDQAIGALEEPIDPGFVQEFQESTLNLPVAQSFVNMLVAESLKAPARVWRAAFRGLMDEDLSGQLRGIAAPTFLMWGDQDGLIDRDTQDLLAGRIADAHLVVYRGCGHSPQWERPDRLAADLTAFITARVAEGVPMRRTQRNAA
jgi:non-heme chloroperoxidase